MAAPDDEPDSYQSDPDTPSSHADDDDDEYNEQGLAAPSAKKIKAKPLLTGTIKSSTNSSSKIGTSMGSKTKQTSLSFGLEPVRNMSTKTTKSPATKPTKASSSKAGTGKAVEEIYQRKTQLEHILLRPDTYIGSAESAEVSMWVFENEAMVYRTVHFVPGLYKIFDEILVNAADNKVRDPSMDQINVTIDRENNEISIMNNGRGVPVTMHAKEQLYVPELIFGNLLTSSNYDDDEKKVTGGRNGYGAKLCNIFSTQFIVETSDSESGKKFHQIFKDNMSNKSKPKITAAAKHDYTKITFKPDLKKFGLKELDDDIIAVLTKRVYDIAGVLPGVKVTLNKERIKIKNFKEYVKLYLDSVFGDAPAKPTIVYEKADPRWEVAFAVSDGQFQQVSFVNSICTSKGGTHVSMIADQLVQKLNEHLKKKNKGEGFKPQQIKSHIWVFVNCLVENPSFDSQTKENLTLKASKFGSKCELSEEFMKKVLKSGIVDNVLAYAKLKQASQLKQTDGTKRARLSGIAKLDDANNAGTKNGQKCTLILTEGDSAKALAISGLGVVGRDNYGVFPLRGKLLNVREASHSQLMQNAEINNIKQILGLKSDKTYTSTESLRYGHVMIMADQDHDGSHIKGLVLNLFDQFWPSLLKNPGFMRQFITPIVKVTKGSKEISFFNIPEYESWKQANHDGRGWHIKYYKGLGTSTAADAKKYFGRMNDHMKPFATAKDEDRQLLELAFSKKKADDRKEWLSNLTPGTFMDHSVRQIPISDFVNKELILFSMADNVRSIPSLIDGFKPGQRKIMFACFKRNLTKGEIKVAQLSGYVAEHSAYHHGEASLQSTIIGLAQDFVGSNNLNLLEPRGQFGTRLQGGKDHAHARYIFTKLSDVTRLLYHPADDKLLTYLNEENISIEPEWYIPILPLVLVNGADGIGTGWSTNIPNHNPRDIVENLLRRLDGKEFVPMHTWYRGFKGGVEFIGDKYKISGVLNKLDDTTVEITELPLGSWTQTYKEFLEGLVAGTDKVPASIKDYKEYHTDTSVHFVVQMTPEQMAKAEQEGLEKKFKMATTKSVMNMVLFDKDGRLRKYESVQEILEEFYELRLEYYEKRKAYLTAKLKSELNKLSNQVRFVLEVIQGDLIVHNRKKANVVQQLRARKYSPLGKDGEEMKVGDESTESGGEAEEGGAAAAGGHGYDYLLSMPIWNLTMEKVQRMTSDRDEKQAELNTLLDTKIQDLWRRDLDAFMVEWDNVETATENTNKVTSTKGKLPGGQQKLSDLTKKRKKPVVKKRAVDSESEEVEDVDSEDEYVEKKVRKTADDVTPRSRPARGGEGSSENISAASSPKKSVKKVVAASKVKTAVNGTIRKFSTTPTAIEDSKPHDPFAFAETRPPTTTAAPKLLRSPAVPGKQRRITEWGMPKTTALFRAEEDEKGSHHPHNAVEEFVESKKLADSVSPKKRKRGEDRLGKVAKPTALVDLVSDDEDDPPFVPLRKKTTPTARESVNGKASKPTSRLTKPKKVSSEEEDEDANFEDVSDVQIADEPTISTLVASRPKRPAAATPKKPPAPVEDSESDADSIDSAEHDLFTQPEPASVKKTAKPVAKPPAKQPTARRTLVIDDDDDDGASNHSAAKNKSEDEDVWAPAAGSAKRKASATAAVAKNGTGKPARRRKVVDSDESEWEG